ncbi:MAG: hypothetical protein IT457_04500 [Planctomycetes bacterium]|nr:hypothetical protein [Planctomycetota bacterium]
MRTTRRLCSGIAILASLALTHRSAAQVFGIQQAAPFPIHSQATINDTRSHGTVGDRWLSLREAMLLTNRQLDENALSAEELAQLSGFGSDIAWADIDARRLPVIVVERDLPVLIDTPHGFALTGSNGRPVIELGNTRGIVAHSEFVDFANLLLRGGEHGIHLVQSNTLYGSLVSHCEFEGQAVAGLRLTTLDPAGFARLQVNSCVFRGLQLGLLVEDSGQNRTTQLEVFGTTRFDGCTTGLAARFGALGTASLYLAGIVARGGAHAIDISSLGSPQRSLAIEMRYCDLEGSVSAFVVPGSPLSNCIATVQACDFGAPRAFEFGPLGAQGNFTLQDSRFVGALTWRGGASGRLAIQNVRASNGRFDVGSTGASLTIDTSILDGIDVATSGTTPLTVRDSRLIAGTVTGLAAAPITVQDGHASGTNFGGHVTVLRPLPAAQLGWFDATPREPAIGSALTLAVDLPAGLAAWLIFGRTYEYGATLPDGTRLYVDPSAMAIAPAMLVAQGQLVVPLPNDPAFRGLDLFFHALVFPQGGTVAPATNLPPGRRVRIR